jgi:hypothetical protein
MREFVLYTAARFGVFAVLYGLVLGVAYLLTGHVPLLWPLLVAAVLSTLVSVVLLRGMRDRLALSIERRAARIAANVSAGEDE